MNVALRLPAFLRLGHEQTNLCNAHFQGCGQCMNDDQRGISFAAFQVVDHRTAHSRKLCQFVLRHTLGHAGIFQHLHGGLRKQL